MEHKGGPGGPAVYSGPRVEEKKSVFFSTITFFKLIPYQNPEKWVPL